MVLLQQTLGYKNRSGHIVHYKVSHVDHCLICNQDHVMESTIAITSAQKLTGILDLSNEILSIIIKLVRFYYHC